MIKRLLLAPAVAAVLALVSVSPVLGLMLWTLTAGPLTATSGTVTTFTLTATNLDVLVELGCLEVDLPPSFTVVGAHAGNASNGGPWEAVVFDGKVAVHSLSGGARLAATESITFTISALPTVAGSFLWPNHAHQREDCAGAEETGTALAILVVQGATASPSPTPSPTATPRPTATSTPTPTPTSTAQATPTSTQRSTRPSATATPSATDEPSGTRTASGSPSPSASASGAVTGSGGASPSPAATDAANSQDPGAARLVGLALPDDSNAATIVSLGSLGAFDGLDTWVIPGAVVGGPGLLVILWVGIQTGVAAAWIPAVRRLRGNDSHVAALARQVSVRSRLGVS